MAERLSKEELHDRFIAAIAPTALVSASTDAAGELLVQLRPPLPNRVRVYIYNATNPPGGRSTPEHKIQPIPAGHQRDQIGNFDWSGVDFVLLCGYVKELDVFVFWDASLHVDFRYSKNLQVRTENVLSASATGVLIRQDRSLRDTGQEVVICSPRQLVPKAIAERASIGGIDPQIAATTASQGQPYKAPPRDVNPRSKLRVFNVDPDAIDRGTNAHKEIQDNLANAVSHRGWQPLSPSNSDPLFDIAWIAGEAAWIVEVKSLTEANEDRQLRLGLGQVLSYAHLVNWDVDENRPVLAVERKPSSPYWTDLCMSHGVALTWPDVFDKLLDSCD